MRNYSTAELRCLEVINLCNGARLGYPTDFTFSFEGDCPHLLSVTVEASKGLFSGETVVIPWCHVECVGEDSILVRLTPEQCKSCCDDRRKKPFWKH
ncbi:MAG: YlmC/YmxH family sporulation protein [Ruminococcaceae bacterium]|nr:YlmC/YmxH family sporulation protein [Oscillospiraceae bacterium]